MLHPLWLAAILLWLAWLIQAVASVALAIKFDRIVRREARRLPPDHLPPAVLIVPFKGVEPAMAQSLDVLCRLDYPAYRLLMVVESEDDPAFAVLQEALGRHPEADAEIVVAGPADAQTGQKVHNLCRALDAAGDLPDHEALVFADSDAVPGADWLAHLVTPLALNPEYAVSTGYRWLVPAADDASRAGPWSHVASILNSSVAMFYVRRAYSHAWGGSMAMLAGTAKRGNLRQLWEGAISDDYQVSRMCEALGKSVYFTPACLVASPVTFDRKGFLNFARRQYLITRTHAAGLYWAALAFHSLYLGGFLTAVGALICQAVAGPTHAPPWWVPAVVLAAVHLGNQIRAGFRRHASKQFLDRDATGRLRVTRWIDGGLTAGWTAIHWLIIVSVLTKRTMTWRGIRYRIDGPQSVRRLS